MKPIHFLFGVAAGAAMGLLFAPKSGADSRAFLADKAQEGADYTKRSVSDGADYLQRQGETLKRNVERVRTAATDTVGAALDAGKQAYNQAVSRA